MMVMKRMRISDDGDEYDEYKVDYSDIEDRDVPPLLIHLMIFTIIIFHHHHHQHHLHNYPYNYILHHSNSHVLLLDTRQEHNKR